MDLKQFVSETLVQILDGISEARQKATLQKSDAEVAPRIRTQGTNFINSGMVTSGGHAVQFVKFDVALTVTEGTGTKGGIGVVAGVLNLGTTGQSQSENSSVTRVQFDVPIIFSKEEATNQ